MGPRRWSRGRDLIGRPGRHAADVLQWGHGDGAVEESEQIVGSFGSLDGFNGATAMEPWKRRRPRPVAPLPGGFNGATAMEPWKRANAHAGMTANSLLQWGHGDGAVEE